MDKTQAPILILSVTTQPYLSISRFYGGINAFNNEYTYIPNHDALIRKDFVKKYNKHLKDGGDWEGFIEIVKSQKK